jgi:hypothetical protein
MATEGTISNSPGAQVQPGATAEFNNSTARPPGAMQNGSKVQSKASAGRWPGLQQ